MTAGAMAHDLRAYAEWCIAHYEDVPPTIVNDLNVAAALIEQQEAKIAELEAKLPRWISVEERLPKKGEDGRDCSWVHCIVSVLATRIYSLYDGEAEEYKFIAPAMFDTEQKIWHVGQEEATFDVNALIQPEDAEGDYIGYWMPYPDVPKGAYLP